MPQEFGPALRDRRRAAGLSQRELAARTGLDFSYISKVENGRVPPPAADTIVALCQVLQTPPEALLALTRKIPSAVQTDGEQQSGGATVLARGAADGAHRPGVGAVGPGLAPAACGAVRAAPVTQGAADAR